MVDNPFMELFIVYITILYAYLFITPDSTYVIYAQHTFSVVILKNILTLIIFMLGNKKQIKSVLMMLCPLCVIVCRYEFWNDFRQPKKFVGLLRRYAPKMSLVIYTIIHEINSKNVSQLNCNGVQYRNCTQLINNYSVIYIKVIGVHLTWVS